MYDTTARIGKSTPAECTCNATTILSMLKRDTQFTDAIRGVPGAGGKDGKTGSPGLTVSNYTIKE